MEMARKQTWSHRNTVFTVSTHFYNIYETKVYWLGLPTQLGAVRGARGHMYAVDIQSVRRVANYF